MKFMENEKLSGFTRISRIVFILLSFVLAACILLQTFFAGAAIFTDPAIWRYHVNFVHFFEFIPILMLVFAFCGKLPNGFKWISGALLLLLFAQYATAHIPTISAIHPVIALLYFCLSMLVVQQSWRFWKSHR